MKKILPILIALTLLTLSCENSQSSSKKKDTFSIHLLADNTITIHNIMEINIDSLEIEADPWLDSEEIDFYDYSTHSIYLNGDKETYFSDDLDINMFGQPFVVIANGRRCYMGSFYSAAMSLDSYHPIIDELAIFSYPADVICLSPSRVDDDDDERDNMYVKEALDNLGKLHEGLELTLTDVQLIDNADIATVKYNFTIKNNDMDDLLVIDPEKMGNALFHYYTHGVLFYSDDYNYYSQYKETESPVPYNSWEPDWYTRIESGKTIERSVTLKGYPIISNGEYNCYFRFSTPIKVEKDDRYIDGSRIWLGNLISNTMAVDISF